MDRFGKIMLGSTAFADRSMAMTFVTKDLRKAEGQADRKYTN
jgi:hypothetical protein